MSRTLIINDQTFTIEKGVEVPPRYNKPWERLVRLMDPGECCFLDTKHQQIACLRAAKKAKIKVLTRKVNGKGFGVWRI